MRRSKLWLVTLLCLLIAAGAEAQKPKPKKPVKKQPVEKSKTQKPAQKSSTQKTSTQKTTTPPKTAEKTAATTTPDAAESEKKVRDIVAFFEYMMNTLGSGETSTRDKEVMITESYSKIFRDKKVQVEDDLDPER